MTLYECLMAGEDMAFEDALTEAWQAIPWMDVDGMELLWQAAAVWNAWAVAGEDVDLGLMAGAFLGLAGQAEVAGDVARARVFDQCYCWSCALLKGEDHGVPELPQELAGLVARV